MNTPREASLTRRGRLHQHVMKAFINVYRRRLSTCRESLHQHAAKAFIYVLGKSQRRAMKDFGNFFLSSDRLLLP